MNKNLNIFNLSLFILFSCLFIIILFLFLQIFFFEYFLLNNIYQDICIDTFFDHFRISEDSPLSNSENRSDSNVTSCTCSSCSFCSRSSSLFTPENKGVFIRLRIYKEISKDTFNKLKNKINNKTKHAVNKIKVFDKTLS
jgi:hypothetical protein